MPGAEGRCLKRCQDTRVHNWGEALHVWRPVMEKATGSNQVTTFIEHVADVTLLPDDRSLCVDTSPALTKPHITCLRQLRKKTMLRIQARHVR